MLAVASSPLGALEKIRVAVAGLPTRVSAPVDPDCRQLIPAGTNCSKLPPGLPQMTKDTSERHFSAPAGAVWHKASATSSPASALTDAMPLMAANIRSFGCMVRMSWASPDCHNARRLCIDVEIRNKLLTFHSTVFKAGQYACSIHTWFQQYC